MMQTRSGFTMVGLFLILLSVFNPPLAEARRLVPVDSDPTPAKGVVVTVRDENQPLANAQVWVETVDGKVLAAGKTGADGQYAAGLADEVLNAGVSVTAAAEGHGVVSYLQDVAHHVTLELSTALPDAYSVLTGKLSGFKDSDDESRASLGLVAKAMEIGDLVALDSSSFISPLRDQVDIFGPRNVPSNIVLPDQTFPVYFIPIHVNKPTFRLPVLSGSSSRYFGVSGSVAVQDAINAIRNNSGWDLVNLLSFEKVGVTPAIPVSSGGQEIAFDVNVDTLITEPIRLKPGRNLTPGDESHHLVVALWEPAPGLFVPTDLKQVQADEVQLNTVSGSSGRVMDVLIGKDGNHFRGSWVATGAATTPDTGLTCTVSMNRLDDTWVVSGGESAQLLVAHIETQKTTSVGNHRYEDRWTVVSPRKAQVRLPAGAFQALQGGLGKISHVSVDLLQTTSGGYAFINGEAASRDLVSLEKVRKEFK